MNPELLATFTQGDTDVEWSRVGKRSYYVKYGLQITRFTDSVKACHEFGECVHHSLECASKLD